MRALAVLAFFASPIPADDLTPLEGISKASLARDRAAAKWVVDRGGQIGILDEGGNAYTQAVKVPDDPFRLIQIRFPRPMVDRMGEPELDFTDDQLRILARLESLTSLQITGTASTGAFVKFLSGSPELTSLSIRGENVLAKAFTVLPKLKSIRHLSLGGPNLTEDCLEYVPKSGALESLAYSGTFDDGRGIAALGKIKALRELAINVEEIPVGVVKEIARLRQISQVTLRHETRADRDKLLRPLAAMSALEELTLRTNVADSDLTNLGGAPHLRFLEIGPSLVNEGSLAHLSDLPELRELRLLLPELAPEGFRHLTGLTKLRRLDLMIDRLDEAACEHVSRLRSLTSLTVVAREFNGEGLSHFSRLGSLTRLHCDGSNQMWSETGITQLAGLQQLQDLILYGISNDVDDALEQIGKLQRLQTLKISADGITGRGFDHLRGLQGLKELHCGGTSISPESLQAISQISSLETLSLGRAEIRRGALGVLAALPKLHTLALFHVTGEERFDSLRSLDNLRRLSIYTHELATQESEVLGTLDQLRELTLTVRLVAPADLRSIRTKLRNCKIIISPADPFLTVPR